MNHVVSVVVLGAVWVVLWGQVDAASVIGGLAVGTLLVVLFPSRDRVHLDGFHLLSIVRFIFVYFWQILVANAIVAWEVMTPGSRVREGIVAVPILGASDAVVSALAHVISGTPGTLIVEIDRGERTVLYVHVLHLHDVERVRRQILELERMLMRAIGSRATLADLEARLRRQPASDAAAGAVERGGPDPARGGSEP